MKATTKHMKPVRLTIQPDANIADIADRLKTPVEYVRRVLSALVGSGARRNDPDFLVFLSLQSDPAAPDYRIYEVMDADTGGGMVLGAYSGRTHKELDYEKALRICWSDKGSTFAEVQDLIGELRKRQTKRL